MALCQTGRADSLTDCSHLTLDVRWSSQGEGVAHQIDRPITGAQGRSQAFPSTHNAATVNNQDQFSPLFVPAPDPAGSCL
jgi:hypothetical protein